MIRKKSQILLRRKEPHGDFYKVELDLLSKAAKDFSLHTRAKTYMKVKSVEFVKSVASISQLPKELYPEIAFAGRSNVGKSSLLNKLFNRKTMALTSSTPGKTRLLNFFLVNENCYFVDLPGYGYARVGKKMQQSWQHLIEQYMLRSKLLRGIVVITDIRHPPQDADLQLIQWLQAIELPVILVGTKADKLSKNKLNKQLSQNIKIYRQFNIDDMVPFSAETGLGKSELLQQIDELLFAK